MNLENLTCTVARHFLTKHELKKWHPQCRETLSNLNMNLIFSGNMNLKKDPRRCRTWNNSLKIDLKQGAKMQKYSGPHFSNEIPPFYSDRTSPLSCCFYFLCLHSYLQNTSLDNAVLPTEKKARFFHLKQRGPSFKFWNFCVSLVST